MRTLRSYSKLINEIINLKIPLKVEIVDYITYDKIFPFIIMSRISKLASENVVMVSGHHGDEYYAVHVLLKWIQQVKLENYPDFNFIIAPIINPFGYETGSRSNGNRKDTNTSKNFYKNSDVKELAILYDNLPADITLYLDIHGDTEKQGVYAYERKPDDSLSLARPALLENDVLLPYEKTNSIYRDKVEGGVITTYGDKDVGLEGVLENIGAHYTIAFELPGKVHGQKRMSGGVAIINSILTHLLKQIKKEEEGETKTNGTKNGTGSNNENPGDSPGL